MIRALYAKWMAAWELALTTRDKNRIVRPLEWGFDWLPQLPGSRLPNTERMMTLSAHLARNSSHFFDYKTPQNFRLEQRPPALFPTNVRPKTLAKDRKLREQAISGKLQPESFLRFTSPVRTSYPENDEVNGRWYPAISSSEKPRQALIVLPQWNADAFSHNALCTLFNRFGISCLRLSKPYHDIRRPAELERSDYAVSSNLGRTIAACQQAVVDIRSCLDWLQQQGYEQFGILGTSLGSCYAFIAAAHDPRLEICAFNHASSWFGDVIWTGQSTRHIREVLEKEGVTQDQLRGIYRAISPMAYMEKFAATPREVLVIHAKYDLTFLEEFSLEALQSFQRHGVNVVSRVLPCGHYTTGEVPYKYLDGWYLGSFIHKAYKRLALAGVKHSMPAAV